MTHSAIYSALNNEKNGKWIDCEEIVHSKPSE